MTHESGSKSRLGVGCLLRAQDKAQEASDQAAATQAAMQEQITQLVENARQQVIPSGLWGNG